MRDAAISSTSFGGWAHLDRWCLMDRLSGGGLAPGCPFPVRPSSRLGVEWLSGVPPARGPILEFEVSGRRFRASPLGPWWSRRPVTGCVDAAGAADLG